MKSRHRIIGSVVLALLLAACGEEPPPHEATEEPGNHEEHTSSGREVRTEVHLSPEQRGLLNVQIGETAVGHAEAIVSSPATIEFDPDLTARVGPRLEAKVVRVPVDLGDAVARGDLLAVLESVELGRARARYLTANAMLETAQAEYAREERLAEQQISSQAELLEARARLREAEAGQQAALEALRLYGLTAEEISSTERGESLSRLTLTSPITGVVQHRELAPGQTLGPNDTPIHIVDDARMWLMIDASESHLDRLKVGQVVEFTSRALDGRSFTGTLDWISRQLEERSRTVTLRAVLDNDEGVLKAGLFGTARVQTGSEGEGPPRVPIDAVQRIDEQDVVFVPGEERHAFRAQPVMLGHEGDGWVEVVSGLEPGDQLVTEGAFDLMSTLTASSRSAEHSH